MNTGERGTGRTTSTSALEGLTRSSESSGGSAGQTEFFSPLPEGYQRGQHRYVVVFGTVMSGLGKGIFSSSVAKVLKDKGLTVAPVKLEGYLNADAGTLNPYRHGEVFVLDDGTECDMDLGTYERLLDQNMSKANFTTSGQIFTEIIARERRGDYLGRDVQMIPHVTGEVKRRLREVATRGDGNTPADVVFVEVGGTVGDYENGFYIEALRELAFEEGPGSVCFVALTYVIEPEALGEQKSKAAQLGIKRLMEAGIQPHVIACRASKPVQRSIREKIAMFSNVPMRRVFSMHDRDSIYTIPEELRSAGIDREILSIVDLHDRVDQAHEDDARERWGSFVRGIEAAKKRSVVIGISGKYTELPDAYASIGKALEHVGIHQRTDVELRWVDTTGMTEHTAAEVLGGVDGVIVPGGFGARGVEGKVAAARYCREQGVPYLGICLGFQVAVIDFARNICGIAGASSSEFDPDASDRVIDELPEQKKIEGLGGTMRLGAQDVALTPNTFANKLYAGTRVRERFRHRYEVDPLYVDRLVGGGLVFSGRHPEQPIMQFAELPASRPEGETGPTHPFFVAAQFHPELTSRPLTPQPMFMGLLAAATVRRYGKQVIAEAASEGIDLERWLPSAASARPTNKPNGSLAGVS